MDERRRRWRRRCSPGTTASPRPALARPPRRARRADPYRVWLSEVMLQQTTVAAVRGYFATFVARWPQVEALAAAPEAEVMAAWAGLGYYARARNLIACARAVAAAGGRFPETEAGCARCPASAPTPPRPSPPSPSAGRAVVVDGNVERVMARLYAVEAPLPGAKPRLRALAAALTPAARPGDYAPGGDGPRRHHLHPARARLRHLPLARALRRPRAPASPPSFRARRRSCAKPVRRGTAYLALRADGAVLVERRPGARPPRRHARAAGHRLDRGRAGAAAALRRRTGAPRREVRHTFTHFHLRLAVPGRRAAGSRRPGPVLPPRPRPSARRCRR